MKIIAAADGSALGNPGPAGWGWYIDEGRWASGGWPHGTNNMGELMAVLDLLRQTRGVGELEVLCDSQYVINSVTRWMPGWKKKGWRKADGKPVMNVDLLKEIDAELSGRAVTFTWVKGHAGHPLNEKADTKAHAAAQRFARGEEAEPGPGFDAPARSMSTPALSPEPRVFEFEEEQESLFEVEDAPSSNAEYVVKLEKSLLDPEVRGDSAALAYLLDPDFREIGSSGRTYDKESVLALLEGEEEELALHFELIDARELAPTLVQVAYRTRSPEGAVVLRSSLWGLSAASQGTPQGRGSGAHKQAGRWRMLWHQGTPENPSDA